MTTPITTSLSDLKDFMAILQAVFTIAAMIIGGIWTYHKFIKKREHYPKLNLSMSLDCLPLNETHNLVHVAVVHENKGEVLMEAKTAEMRLRLVAPLQPEEGYDPDAIRRLTDPAMHYILWPALEIREYTFTEDYQFEIEPKESDTLHADFLVEKWVTSVQVYYYIRNIEKGNKNLGWALSNYYVLPCPAAESR